MRIGVDARELCGHATGAGRYLSGLLREWANDTSVSHEFLLYAPRAVDLSVGGQRFTPRVVPGAPGTFWEQVRLPRAAAGDRLDVFFAPAYTAPLRLRVPLVLAVHDVSFLAHPEWFRVREGTRRRWLTRRSAFRADAVVTISEFSRREVLARLHVPAGRVHVIFVGITPPVDTSFQAARTPREPRVLFVGSIFNRRHVPDLIRAFGELARRRPNVALDLVGENRTYPRQELRDVIVAEGLDGRVCWHEYVTDDRLRALYARAGAFAFLSEYEGFGLTPLEALSAGVPPVLLDTAVAREACGDAALYVPLHDPGAISGALERALFDPSVRDRILAAAPAVLGRYDWSRTARETLALLEQAGRPGPAPSRGTR
jgi:glycosyltransferase involved in cell wall biosynthesis